MLFSCVTSLTIQLPNLGGCTGGPGGPTQGVAYATPRMSQVGSAIQNLLRGRGRTLFTVPRGAVQEKYHIIVVEPRCIERQLN